MADSAPSRPPPAAAADRLPRRLGAWSAAAVLVGSTIGSGIFRVPSTVAAEAEAIALIAGVWILGGLMTLCGVLTVAELATMYPKPGGLYVYIREAFGPLPAFLFGWTRLLVIQPSLLGGIAMIFASYARTFVPLDEAGVRVLAAGVILTLAAANYRSIAWAAGLQNVSTAAKVAALAGVSALLFAFGGGAGGGALAQGGGAAVDVRWAALGVALISVMWTFDGWADLTYVAGEVRDPARALPRALIGGSIAVALIYLAVNAAFLYVLPLEEAAASTLIAADAAERIFGASGAALVSALVMLSTFGAINGPMMTGPRTFYALAADGLFFRRVADVHPRFRTPHVAIVLAALLGVAYLSVRTFEQLAEAFVLGITPFYALAVGAVFRLRRTRAGAPRPYRTPGYPVVPLFFLAGVLFLLGSALVRRPGITLFGFGVILAGVPVFYLWARLRRRSGVPRDAGGGLA
jgi:basic amino acid/polyamine antiporter, APA family